MKLEFLDSKDFWAGVVLMGVGALALLIARDYPFGTMVRMGAGYFPTVLGGLLVAFGLYLLSKGLRRDDKIEAGWSLRALIVLPLALALFGFLMDRVGFVPALVVLVFGSAAAGSEFKLLEIVALTVLLTALSVAVFVWGLGLPYPLFAGH
jgi:Tripartite tricarboxylate transporter TctB family